jgi:hypothetical protein
MVTTVLLAVSDCKVKYHTRHSPVYFELISMCKSNSELDLLALSLRSSQNFSALGIAFFFGNHRNVNSFNGIHQIAIVIQLEQPLTEKFIIKPQFLSTLSFTITTLFIASSRTATLSPLLT